MIDNEVKDANLTIEGIKKQVNLNIGITIIKQEWTKGLIDAIKAFHSSMINFHIEEKGSHSQANRLEHLINIWRGEYLVMHDLRRRVSTLQTCWIYTMIGSKCMIIYSTSKRSPLVSLI